MKILLVRHGETVANAIGTLQGQSPGMLNSNGINQANKLGKSLVDNNIDLIISSDLERSNKTAEIINQHINIPHIKDSIIREKDWGSFTGKNIKDVDIYNPPLDAESNEMIYKRANTFINNIKSKYPDKSLLVVGHGITNQAIMAVLQDIPHNKMHNIEIQKNTDIWTWE